MQQCDRCFSLLEKTVREVEEGRGGEEQARSSQSCLDMFEESLYKIDLWNLGLDLNIKHPLALL